MHYKLGIDVGGTNTDAVVIDENMKVLAAVKRHTSEDVYEGILNSVDAVLDESKVDAGLIDQAMLGTTQCTNAIVQRKGLSPVAILRIGAPATEGIPPMVDWDDSIRAVCVDWTIIGGGFEFNGKRLAQFDEDACRAFLNKIKGKVDALAISCVFSTMRNDDEVRAAAIAHEILGEDFPISLSSEIGSMGLVERENATILNAALNQVAQRFTEGFAHSLKQKGIVNADVYLSQNDGTLMTIENARRYPILTIACGPTNSIRGASYLTRRDDAIVIDVGGTTTDFGVLSHGFPRESGVAVDIGGVRTNFRMPDVISIGLGGGSIVTEHEDGSVTVGPQSVGYQITEKALCFGGDVMTATDIADRLGMAEIGDPKLTESISKETADKALAAMREMVEDSIDAMKISSDPIDVILVGGGSVIFPQDLAGTKSVTCPEFAGCANAIGSAISKVSGTFEKLVDYEKTGRDQALENARKEAIALAVAAGADESTVEIIDSEDVPLAYYPGKTSRVRIKAAGDLRTGSAR
ncbi:hydantoinase/oxoprolinase family protein [Bifidobacterium sp. ESL0690]|uniref:hydantoinase/oxoprolinase family protein n=1 Tax=Bifidobacterium sp. ESL0690 TaxID=2983214 RepID=UPI0023F84C7C|nr:hydantoinase/oxoprolinase family protein [Bifidobacterium sp. ESL0690]WEV45908.1 hydantoinase/oxoprolinase family protein [Bifidobacterium sp. ESL0690]